MQIETVKQFIEALNNKYASAVVYPIFFYSADGQAFSYDVVKENREEIIEGMSNPDLYDEWCIAGYSVNWEDHELYCSHSNEPIESAY